MKEDSIADLKTEISELRKELDFTRDLLESANSIIVRWDKNGIINYINDFGLKFFGYSAQELRGHAVTKIIPKVDKSTGRPLDKLAEDIVINPEAYKFFRNENITKDGRTVWVTWTNKGFFDEQGNLEEILAIGNDITALKEAEQARRDYQGKLTEILEGMNDSVMVSDCQEKLIHLNEAFAHNHGFKSKAECPTRLADYPKILDVFLADGTLLPMEQWAIPRALRGESDSNVEYTIQRKDTGDTWVGSYNFGPFFDRQGNIAGALVVGRDITERKQAEIELQTNQYYLAKAQEIGHIGTWELDIPNNKLLWTDENCRIFGVPPGRIVNYEIFIDKVHPEDRDYVNRTWQAATQGKPYDIEHRILIDGETKWLREKADLTFDEQGTALSAIGFTQDITDIKQAEEDKLNLEKQLQQAQRIESIGHLAGGVAHDFNNMLGVILGHTELALTKAAPDNPFVEDLEQIHTAAKRSADLTRQLLTFARKETIAPKVFDLNETVAGMLTMLQRLIGENIQLGWNPAADLWAVKMDPAQLDQILANLCVNARDAIGDIGKIVIETHNCTFSARDLKGYSEASPGDYVRLSVSDNGHGMKQEVLDQIFEPFFTTKEFGQGTGLGLATVYGAVKQNQGFIDVSSEPGQGATFHIYLPRQQASKKTEEEATAQPPSQGEGTVLVVEDDQMLLNLTQTMLEESGYTVLAAATSDTALSLAKDHPDPIDLLLSDIIMPEMNGRDLRDQLLAMRPELKVLFMSGYPDDIIAKQGIIEEGTQFLHKPITLEALTTKVRQVLDQN